MLSTSHIWALGLALSYLVPSASARAIWTLEELNGDASHSLHPRGTCSADPSLSQCPSEFPSNFCCPKATTCMHINTRNTSITAAICCPAGQDCATIHPISCNETFQDANVFASSQIHSIPPQPLDSCGDACCPMGFKCNGKKLCVAQVALSATFGANSPSSTTGSSSSGSTTATGNGQPLSGQVSRSSGHQFGIKAFIAGLVPGIAIGAIIAALIVFLCLRKKRKSEEYTEKGRDTLTDLAPTHHGRSISEPTADPTAFTRTDFLRGSPPRTAGSSEILTGAYNNDDSGPKTPRGSKVRALFGRSPYLSQTPSTPPPPIPAHVNRGAPSFGVSPIRHLKKQKSMYSLRRQMTESEQIGSNLGRTESQETIQVLMPNNDPYTPDQRNTPYIVEEPAALNVSKNKAPASAGTWATSTTAQPQQVPYASSSRYPSEQPQLTPTRPPVPRINTGGPSFLDEPYSPTKDASRGTPGGGLTVPERPDERRDTTFSSLMEKAGLRKSDLVMGSKKKIDAKYGW